jgi:hypothetical protein
MKKQKGINIQQLTPRSPHNSLETIPPSLHIPWVRFTHKKQLHMYDALPFEKLTHSNEEDHDIVKRFTSGYSRLPVTGFHGKLDHSRYETI